MSVSINNVKSNKYGYLKAGNVDENQITSFAVTNKQYSVDYKEIKLIYAAIAKDLKKETFEKLGLSESDDIDKINAEINETYNKMNTNAKQAIENLPRLINIAKEVNNFEKSLDKVKKGLTGKLRDDIANDTDISTLLGNYDIFMTNINDAMTNGTFANMRELIDSTYRITGDSEEDFKWEKEVGNLSGTIGEALIFSTMSIINGRDRNIIQGSPVGPQGQKILGLETAYDSNKNKIRSKGDVRLLITVNGNDILLNFSIKTTMQKKPGEFKAAKELSLNAIPVSDDFKIDIKELAAASIYSGVGTQKSDSLLFRKFIASLLASYAFGGSFNRALNIIYFTANGGGNPPLGKITFRFFFQYFEKVAAGKQGSFPNLTFNKFLIDIPREGEDGKDTRNLSYLFSRAKDLNTISMNISGKFL